MTGGSSLPFQQVAQMLFTIWDFYMPAKILIFWTLLPGQSSLTRYSESSRTDRLLGPGHNSFTRSTDDTEDLMVYHARQEERYLGEGDYQPLYDAGRNAYIGKVFWDENGMPDFSVPGASLAMRKEDLILPESW